MYSIKYIVFIFCIVAFAAVDFFQQSIHLLAEKKQIEQLHLALQNEKRNSNKKTPTRISSHVTKEKITEALFVALDMSGLALQSILVTENNLNSQSVVHADMQLIGNFQQFIEFYNRMTRQCFPFAMGEAKLLKNHNQLKMKLGLSLSTQCMNHKSLRSIPSIRDPFQDFSVHPMQNAIHLFSIKQLRSVGFFQYVNDSIAVIQLPNGKSSEVVVGDVLGLEKARVIRVNKDGVFVRLNGSILAIKK